jgi:hypothetical protein
MSDLRDAAQQALKSLRGYRREISCEQPCDAEQALVAALEQPEQEPVAWMSPASDSMIGKTDENGSAYHIITTSKKTANNSVPLFAHPPRREPEQEPEACFIGTKGSAFDLPTTKRAYTYAEQPGNVASSKLGRALEAARRCSAGDNIDAGLVLLKALQAEGFGVFQLGAEYTHPPSREWRGLTEEEIYPLYSEPSSDAEMVEFARAIEAALRSKNYE